MNFKSIDILSEEEINTQYDELLEDSSDKQEFLSCNSYKNCITCRTGYCFYTSGSGYSWFRSRCYGSSYEACFASGEGSCGPANSNGGRC